MNFLRALVARLPEPLAERLGLSPHEEAVKTFTKAQMEMIKAALPRHDHNRAMFAVIKLERKRAKLVCLVKNRIQAEASIRTLRKTNLVMSYQLEIDQRTVFVIYDGKVN